MDTGFIFTAELFEHFVDAQIIEVHGHARVGSFEALGNGFITAGAAIEVHDTAFSKRCGIQFFDGFGLVQTVFFRPLVISENDGAATEDQAKGQ